MCLTQKLHRTTLIRISWRMSVFCGIGSFMGVVAEHQGGRVVLVLVRGNHARCWAWLNRGEVVVGATGVLRYARVTRRWS